MKKRVNGNDYIQADNTWCTGNMFAPLIDSLCVDSIDNIDNISDDDS